MFRFVNTDKLLAENELKMQCDELPVKAYLSCFKDGIRTCHSADLSMFYDWVTRRTATLRSLTERLSEMKCLSRSYSKMVRETLLAFEDCTYQNAIVSELQMRSYENPRPSSLKNDDPELGKLLSAMQRYKCKKDEVIQLLTDSPKRSDSGYCESL